MIISIYQKIIAALVGVSLIACVYLYISNQQAKIVRLSQENAIMQAQAKDLEQKWNEYNKQIKTLNQEKESLQTYKNDVLKKLNKHSLEGLINAKPKLIENIINRGVNDNLRMFERTTSE